MSEEKHRSQVFISYSRRDLAFVEQLAADLQAAGLGVWYDFSELKGGAGFPTLSIFHDIIPLLKSR